MRRNVVCIALFTAVVATGELPRTALASCSGNTCTFGQFGKVTFLAAKQSMVEPLLTKVDTSYTSAFSSYSQAMDLFRELKSLTSKFGTKEQIAAEALARRAKDNDSLKAKANDAAGSAVVLQGVKNSIVSAQNHLVNAKKNLQLAQRELQTVRDANRVSELKAAAERAQSLDIFEVASSAAEVAGKGELSTESVKSLLGAATKLIGAFRSANLQKQAEDLAAAVSKASEANGKDKVALAASEFKQAQSDLTALGQQLPNANTYFENAMKIRDAAYNKGDAPKYGRLEDLSKADETAGRLTRLLKQAYTDAYTVQMTIDRLEKSGDWLAPPQGESVQTLHAVKSKADFIFKDCVNQRPVIESVQKLIQDAYEAANISLNSKL